MHCCPLVRHWADGPRKKHGGINVRDMKNEGGGGMQTTMSLNCNSQSTTFIVSDAIIISNSKIHSDGLKRKAVKNGPYVYMRSFTFRLNFIFIWNPKLQYRVHKSKPLNPILSQLDPIQALFLEDTF
jgi:hypothetical protein